MTRRLFVSVAVVALACFAAATPAVSAPNGITVTLDRTAIQTSLGKKFAFRSVIANHGSTTARDLIAHLNVLSLRSGVYVDPEDWSSHRTRYLPPIRAGGSLTIGWRLQAVNSGSIGVYIAVLPRNGTSAPTTGPTLHVSIAHRTTLNSGGILPLALGIPGLLAALLVVLRLRAPVTARSARRPRAV
jgi:hypothetical protein